MNYPSVFQVLAINGGPGKKYTRVEVKQIFPEAEFGQNIQRDCILFQKGKKGRAVSLRKTAGGFEIKGVPVNSLHPGALIVPDGYGAASSDTLYLGGKLPSSGEGKITTPFGTYSCFFSTFGKQKHIYKCRTSEPVFGLPLIKCICMANGLLDKSMLIHMGLLTAKEEKALSDEASGFSYKISEKELLHSVLKAAGFIRAGRNIDFEDSARYGSFLISGRLKRSLQAESSVHQRLKVGWKLRTSPI